MLYLLSSLFFLIFDRRKYSLSTYLFFLLFLSALCSFFVGRQHFWDYDSIIYVLYIDIFLCLLLLGYRRFSSLRGYDFSSVNQRRLRQLEKTLINLGNLVLVIDVFILYKIFTMLTSELFTVQEFKNEGGAEDVFASIVPHPLMTFGRLFSPLGYLYISFHFYYLILDKKRRAFKYLILSMVLVLNGIITLSRSATVEYLLVYTGILFFVMPLLRKSIRRSIIKYSFLFGMIILSLLFVVSSSRFSDFYSKKSKNVAILDESQNPLFFSTIDYFSLWQEQSIEYLQKRKPGQIYYGMYNSFGLGEMILKRIYGNKVINEKREKEIFNKLGDISYSFHGPIARLVYDFGYIGSVLFVLIYFCVLNHFSPQKGVLRFRELLFIPLLLPLGVLFFVGNALGSLSLDIAIIYGIVIYIITKHNKKNNEKVVANKCNC